MDKKMKNKTKEKVKNQSIWLIGGICAVLVIGLIIFLVAKKPNDNEKLNNPTSNEKDKNSSATQGSDYTCYLETANTEDYINSTTIKLNVKDGQITNGVTETKFECKNKSFYDGLVADEEFMKDKTADENKLTISLIENVDYTKNTDGEAVFLNFDDYKSVLETNGYKCN